MAIGDSIAAHFEAVLRGEAVMVSPAVMLPDGGRVMGDDEGLPRLPDTGLVIAKARSATQPLTDFVAEAIAFQAARAAAASRIEPDRIP